MNNPLVQVDPGLFIWTIATFLVLLTLLAKFAWRPLLQALAAREETIRKSLADAEKARLELERLNQESEAIIRQARIEAEAIIGSSRADAERLRGELRDKARAEAEGILKNAERQIQLETARALEQIRHEAADLSVAIASKLIQKNITKEDNERLIEDALKQMTVGRAYVRLQAGPTVSTAPPRSVRPATPHRCSMTRVRCREAVARSPAALASAASFISGWVHTASAAEAFWYQLCASAAFPCASLRLPSQRARSHRPRRLSALPGTPLLPRHTTSSPGANCRSAR